MESLLYTTFRKEMQALSIDATRVRLGPEIRPERMKAYSVRIAWEVNVPVTVRRVAEGVLFWHSSDEDLQRALELAQRLQAAQRKQKTRRGGGQCR